MGQAIGTSIIKPTISLSRKLDILKIMYTMTLIYIWFRILLRRLVKLRTHIKFERFYTSTWADDVFIDGQQMELTKTELA